MKRDAVSEEIEIEELEFKCKSAFWEFDFDFYEWNSLQSQAFSQEEIVNAALYLWGRMKRAKDLETWIVPSQKKINSWYQKNKGFKVYRDHKDFHGKGYYTYVYKNPDEKAYFFYDTHIHNTKIIDYMIEEQMLVFVGTIEHQSTPHLAWTIKI